MKHLQNNMIIKSIYNSILSIFKYLYKMELLCINEYNERYKYTTYTKGWMIMEVCDKCHCEKEDSEIKYYPYIDQWICDDCITEADICEDEYLACMYND